VALSYAIPRGIGAGVGAPAIAGATLFVSPPQKRFSETII
jgi:hypothetical protein